MRSPTDEDLVSLIDNHVLDEVIYREALAMGLDQNDPQVRARMRMKFEFLFEDLTAAETPSDEELFAFLQQHGVKFRVEPQFSFRQLYLNPAKHPDYDADAQKIVDSLNMGVAPDSHGDTTMLQYEYRLLTQNEIARSFGEEFSTEVVTIDTGDWTGPVYSSLGIHLVHIFEQVDGYMPELPDVRNQVEREYLAQRRQELKDKTYQKLREGYEVVIELLLTSVTAKTGEAIAATPPEEWKTVSEPTVRQLPDSALHRRIVDVMSGSINGSIIRLPGLESTITDVFVRISRLDGSETSQVIRPTQRFVELRGERPWYESSREYLLLGLHHILMGIDHLLFVLGLLIIVSGRSMLIKTITAFTVAHSITLAIATPGWSPSVLACYMVLVLPVVFPPLVCPHQKSPWRF